MNSISYTFRSTDPLTQLHITKSSSGHDGMIVLSSDLDDLDMVYKWLSEPWLNLY